MKEQPLPRVGLPEDLSGKTVLDLCCGRGFYCLEAKRRGASRVVGLDESAHNIDSARKTAASERLDIEFRTAPPTAALTERFDVVLLVSVLHKLERPKHSLWQVHSLLVPEGLLILQCGINNFPYRQLQRVIGEEGEYWFPSHSLLIDDWLEPFAVRWIGKSTLRGSDQYGGAVFHCTPRKPTVIFVSGEGLSGKTSITRNFKDAVIITTDSFASVAKSVRATPASEQQQFEKAVEQFKGNRGRAWKSLRSDIAVTRYFALTVVECYAVADIAPQIMEELKDEFIFWNLTRQQSPNESNRRR
jgi:SAM-dependent methyltransferase